MEKYRKSIKVNATILKEIKNHKIVDENINKNLKGN